MTTCPLSRVSVALSSGQLRGTAGRDRRRRSISLHLPRRLNVAVAAIGDTEMLPRALAPGAGLVTHRRACRRQLTATPPN